MKKKTTRRIMTFAASAAAAAALAGCAGGPGAQTLGPGASTGALKGTVSLTQVFPGGARQPSIIVSAAALKAGSSYQADGAAVTLNGNLPPNVTVNVTDGTLKLNGNAGAGDKLDAEAPVVTHDETYSCYTYGFTISGKYGYGYVIDGCSDTVTDGLRFNGPSSILTITGANAPKTQVTSNGGISIHGKSVKNPNKLTLAPS